MILIKETASLKIELERLRARKKTVGFVPTMGALHAGHIALIQEAKAENAICVCSIFINPTQFNNAVDLQHYPVTIEHDIDLLEKNGCDILFLPSVKEMYPPGEAAVHYDLGYLETILEGKYRPGHFQGVCMIVDKLLSAVTPDQLFLGRKDYQQCLVIRKMMTDRGFNAALRICETVREDDGLAMSSRNMRLHAGQRKKALHIIESLRNIKEGFRKKPVAVLQKECAEFLESRGFKVDYAEIADTRTLEPFSENAGQQNAVALIAAYLDGIRLIDNLIL